MARKSLFEKAKDILIPAQPAPELTADDKARMYREAHAEVSARDLELDALVAAKAPLELLTAAVQALDAASRKAALVERYAEFANQAERPQPK